QVEGGPTGREKSAAMGAKILLFGLALLFSLVEGSSSFDATLVASNDSESSALVESSTKMIKNDSLALDGQYYIGGLNRISEYRAKQNINDAYSHFYDEDFMKSTKDSNKYSFIRLKNDLQVFVVSKRSVSFPSITLGVRVGSSMEPRGFPGLATLLSELLFYEWKRSEPGQRTPYDLFISRNSVPEEPGLGEAEADPEGALREGPRQSWVPHEQHAGIDREHGLGRGDSLV
ncbi:signal peptide-containing secreted insulinase-like peptidase, partial [Cryptosporidium canis]